jgi:hypothetical protein
MGAGFIAASLLGSLAGQPAAAYQATFNLQVPNVAGQTARTFIDGPPSNHTMVMMVDTNGGASAVTTSETYGLCTISGDCNNTDAATLNRFTFSKPIQNFSFKVGLNTPPPTVGWNGANFNSFLRLRIGLTDIAVIPLANLTAGNTIYTFTPSILVAANTAITVGFQCTGTCAGISGSGQFWISDVIVEVPAPLPLIGTGAAFAWTRRLRRRIKATPRPIING